MSGLIEEFTLPVRGRQLYTCALCRSLDNPVILFIHGGPGYGTSYSLSRTFLAHAPDLLDKYTLVFFDQRCAGESFRLEDLLVRSSVEDYLSDIGYLCRHYLDRYKQAGLFIAGHSWGSIIGLKYAMLHPEQVLGYVGIGQVVDGLKGELVSYEYTLRRARHANTHAYKLLKRFGPPPHSWHTSIRYLLKQRKFLSLFGGFQKSMVPAPYPRYTSFLGRFAFKVTIGLGMYLSTKRLWRNCLDTNFNTSCKHFSFPVIFICGRYDHLTPTSLVIAFYRSVRSKKQIYVLDKSGHRPHLEEIGKFSSILAAELDHLRDIGE